MESEQIHLETLVQQVISGIHNIIPLIPDVQVKTELDGIAYNIQARLSKYMGEGKKNE